MFGRNDVKFGRERRSSSERAGTRRADHRTGSSPAHWPLACRDACPDTAWITEKTPLGRGQNVDDVQSGPFRNKSPAWHK